MDAPKDATAATRAALARATAALPPDDGADFERVRRGFIATRPDARIEGAGGRTVWDLAPFAFEQAEDAPDTVHPALWRQARLNLSHGLFKVTASTRCAASTSPTSPSSRATPATWSSIR